MLRENSFVNSVDLVAEIKSETKLLPGDKRVIFSRNNFESPPSTGIFQLIDGTTHVYEVQSRGLEEHIHYYIEVEDAYGRIYREPQTGYYTFNFMEDSSLPRIFPNPSHNGIFNIDFKEAFSGPMEIYIYNLLGKEMSRFEIDAGGQQQVDLSQLQTGPYILSFWADNKLEKVRISIRN